MGYQFTKQGEEPKKTKKKTKKGEDSAKLQKTKKLALLRNTLVALKTRVQKRQRLNVQRKLTKEVNLLI